MTSYSLQKELSLANSSMIRQYANKALKDDNLLYKIIDLGLSSIKELSSHAAWVIDIVAKRQPEKLQQYQSLILEQLPNLQYEDQIGTFLSTLVHLGNQEDHSGILQKYCLVQLKSDTAPAHIKYYSISLLVNIAVNNPDNHEPILTALLREQHQVQSKYLQKTINKAIKKLQKLELV